MLERIHEKLGTAGFVVAVIALVAALAGTAFAAAKLNKTQKREVEKIAKKSGKPGPAGAQGPAGAAGAKGSDGAAGPKGETGAPGAEGKEGKQGEQGIQGKQGIQGIQGIQGEQGKEGSPWVAGQAPPKVILKGTWSIQQYSAEGAGEQIPTPISTGVPIPPTNSGLFAAAIGGGLSNGEEESNAEFICPGTAENPTINSEFLKNFGENGIGGLCVYAQSTTNLLPPPAFSLGLGAFGLASSGGGMVAMFKSEGAGDASGFGSWVLFTPSS